MKNKDQVYQGIIYLIIGILLVIGISGNSIIGWILSISLLVCGGLLVILGYVHDYSLIGYYGMSGAVFVTLGLALLPPIALFSSYFQAISLLMIVVGAFFIVDSIICFASKFAPMFAAIIFVIGALLFTFGMLLWFNVGNMQAYASLILGIVLIVYGGLLLISGITGKVNLARPVRKKKTSKKSN